MAPIFKNQVVAVSGTFKEYRQADLKDMVESNGGTFSPKVTDSCTHLVCTQKEVDGNGTKYKQATSIKDVKIVSLDWLVDSVTKKKRAKEAPYLYNQANGASAPSSDATNTRPTRSKRQANAKRALDTTPDDDSKDDEDKEPPVKKQKDAQKSSAPTLKIPVDERCPYLMSHQVYIDSAGLIYDAALNQTNSSNNNNKFYLIQLLASTDDDQDDYVTWTRWGRVGENGQNAVFSGLSLVEAMRVFESKFRTKSGLAWKDRLDPPKGGKYTFVERNYEDDDEDEDAKPKKKVKKEEDGMEIEVKAPESKLPVAVQQLVGLIFNKQYFASTMASMSYDANKLPLGKLSKRTLQSGFQLLKDLAELVATPSISNQKYGYSFHQAAEYLSNQYFTIIPHAFGRSRPPVISSQDLIKREVDLLETLTDMEIANEILNQAKASEETSDVHPLDRQYAGLCLNEMTPLDSKSTEFEELSMYLSKSRGQTHSFKYKVQHIFRIERDGENDRFAQSPFANLKNSNRRLLWHGSRTTNFGGILSQGLRIAPPEAPVSGYMFGKGVYFADISSKSAGYCWSHSSNNLALLLLCDVELGDPMLELRDSDYNAGEKAQKEGKLATLGRGQTVPQGWKDASCVHQGLKGVMMPDVSKPPGPSGTDAYLQYNEYIVYNTAQIRQKYLFCVQMR
ncbi:hypothetical protein AJ80_02552 [Polytolypa hystricis UAMH7299]|uniref:Poly [ADP-ribose] polymerase n=1 Tax=Polytolypa hystricis (strain UAMH7299) TaxID=1447883 RepID=A0A2B7YRF4_POLH7|nr:hypothetical protein AJ80_02552 [Polytolypa hystricis UAMH7299]